MLLARSRAETHHEPNKIENALSVELAFSVLPISESVWDFLHGRPQRREDFEEGLVALACDVHAIQEGSPNQEETRQRVSILDLKEESRDCLRDQTYEPTIERPGLDSSTGGVSRRDDAVRSIERIDQSGNQRRGVGEICVHDAHEIPTARPETVGDCAPQTSSSVPRQHAQIHRELSANTVRQNCRAVRRVIVDQNDLEWPLQTRLEGLELPEELFNVLPLVKRRDDDG